jgi:hypothetical protein
MTPLAGPPFSAIHLATRRTCDLAGYFPDGGGGRSGFAIGFAAIMLRVMFVEDDIREVVATDKR